MIRPECINIKSGVYLLYHFQRNDCCDFDALKLIYWNKVLNSNELHNKSTEAIGTDKYREWKNI